MLIVLVPELGERQLVSLIAWKSGTISHWSSDGVFTP
jgi:hypothetical protein